MEKNKKFIVILIVLIVLIAGVSFLAIKKAKN